MTSHVVSFVTWVTSNVETASMYWSDIFSRTDCTKMMSVVKISRKRLPKQGVPPGFQTRPAVNRNNSAKKAPSTSRNHRGLSDFTGLNCCQKSAEVEGDSIETHRTVFNNAVGAVKKCKPTHSRKKHPAENVISPLVPDTYSDVIGGEAVVVNQSQTLEEEDERFVLDERLTPPNYEETYDYFLHVATVRADILKSVCVLGDLLLLDEVEGDRQEWQAYTERVESERKVWLKRCEEDNKQFEKTRTPAGQGKNGYLARSAKFVQEKKECLTSILHALCPCFFPG